MANETIRLKPIGVNIDIPASELSADVYSRVNNMSMRNGAAQRADGYNNAASTLLHPCDFVIGNRRPDTYFFLYPGDDGGGVEIAVTDLFVHADITPAVAPTDSTVGKWTGAELNGLLMLCNGVDQPWFWDGDPGNVMLPLPNFPAGVTAGWIRAFKYFAIAGNILDNGVLLENQFLWSATVEPGQPPVEWAPLPSNDAGDNILASTPGTLIDGHPLRDHFILAKQHSMYLLNYVAGQFVFTVHKLSVTTGALSANCMTEETGFLYVFTDGDIIRSDGQSVVSIATQRVKRAIFSTMNQAAIDACYVVNYVAQDEIWFCFPTGANEVADTAAVYDHVQDQWGIRELPEANHIAPGIVTDSSGVEDWDSDSQAWDLDATAWGQSVVSEIEDGILIASAQELLFGVGLSDLANGSGFQSGVNKDSMDLGDYTRVKLVTQVWPYVTGFSGDICRIRVGSQFFDGEPIEWGPVNDFVIGVDSKVDVLQAGRLISFALEGPQLNPWSIQSFAMRYNPQGLF